MSKRKAPSEDNLNNDFCDFLIELADYERNVNRNEYKYKAYRKAASALAEHPVRITSGKEAKKLMGIGDKISKKIDEYLQTGKLRKLETIHNDESSTAINLLTRVSGIGPAKAQSLVAAGIKTLEDLRKNEAMLTHHQVIGLRYFEDFEKKIPRSEIERIEKTLVDEISRLDREFDVTICGSFRRGKAESGDIDALVTHPTFTGEGRRHDGMLGRIVDALKKCGLVTDTLSSGERKFMGACKVEGHPTRRLDIRLTPSDQYHCAVLYFTGSDLFNVEMRAHALQEGFTLNEYFLRPMGSTGLPGEPLDIASEQDIFDCIDFPYKEPFERNK